MRIDQFSYLPFLACADLVLSCGQRTMVIAMISMWMVKLPFIEIIHVISMGNGVMSTCVMATCTTRRSTTIGILAIHGDHMLVIVPFMGRVEMTVMQVIDMTVMLNCCMPAMLAVNMGVVRMDVMTHISILLGF
jgi:hypothetical protein